MPLPANTVIYTQNLLKELIVEIGVTNQQLSLLIKENIAGIFHHRFLLRTLAKQVLKQITIKTTK